jgi:uncharacterized protein involved in exopolysaccharide biosynthesis
MKSEFVGHMLARLVLIITLAFFGSQVCFGQKTLANPKPSPVADTQPIRSTPAYADLLLEKTELQSSLDALLVDYTEQYPKVKELRSQLGFLNAEMDRLLAVKPENAGRLSDALGKLMLRKVELESNLEALRAQYKDDHPEVKKLRRKIETYEASIKEILG